MRNHQEQYQYQTPGAKAEAEDLRPKLKGSGPEMKERSEASRIPLRLKVNGKSYPLYVEARRTLLDALREDCELTGAKKACDMGNCGACTVMVDGKAVYSCLVLAAECEDRELNTIEGVSNGGNLTALQEAFIEHDAFQCGYCTAGQIMSLTALFDKEPAPDLEAIERAVSGNLCRCGAYRHILRAAQAVAEGNRGERRGS